MNRLQTATLTLCCGLLLVGTRPGRAAVINAASGAYSDVTNAISKASYGDTVQIPAGTWTWTVPNVYVSGITLQGAGTNATFILDGLPYAYAGIAYMVDGIAVTNALTRITGITFGDSGGGAKNFHGKIEMDGRAAGSAASWRIDHCTFTNLQGPNIYVHGFAVSVIDHCNFILNGVANSIAISHYGLSSMYGDPWGDVSWASPPTYGTNTAGLTPLYIESNIFSGLPGGQSAVNDATAGARSVFRFNTVSNSFWANHGNDTSGRYRGMRQFEIYNNTFTDSRSFYSAMDFRSGTGMVYSNTVVGYGLFNSIENYRNVEPNAWGGVTGFNPWDSNSPTIYFSGTITNAASSYTLPVCGANWTSNQWAGYILYDTTLASNYLAAGTNFVPNGSGGTTQPGNMPVYCLIQGNNANELVLTPPKDFPFMGGSGDQFVIYYCGAALDQVGRGSGDLIQDITVGSWPNNVTWTINTATGTNTWPHQVLEPLYSWANTLNGNPAGIKSLMGYSNIQEGRDIYSNQVAPGYVPLPYPHPLTLGDGAAAASSGGSVDTNSTPALSPPSDLKVSKP